MTTPSAFHVMVGLRWGWSVRRTGANRALRVFALKRNAIQWGRAEARKVGAVLFVHGEDGRVAQRIEPRSVDLTHGKLPSKRSSGPRPTFKI